jgi:hypothetical protein
MTGICQSPAPADWLSRRSATPDGPQAGRSRMSEAGEKECAGRIWGCRSGAAPGGQQR